jgi:tetraacyldisaccharide 4'-kinase
MDAAAFKDVVSGRRRGLAAAGLRMLLRVAETPYSAAVRMRNRRYDLGRAEICRVGVPVVSVGNLTLGGTGKTPMVEWVVRWFLDRGVRVGIVSRGYGSQDGHANDEARELAARLPGVPHVQNRDRVAAAREAIDKHGCQAIVMDDGFQHRRLFRDLDIVLIDATEPFGFEHVFPRGTLREPIAGLCRAQVAVLSRADLVSAARREKIRRRVLEIAPTIEWLESVHAPRWLESGTGERQGLDWLAGKRVAAFCGIGNPAGFEQTLRLCGVNLVGFRAFADHFDYQQNGDGGAALADELSQWAKSVGAETLVATCKDLVKLPVRAERETPLWALAIGLEFDGMTQTRSVAERKATLLDARLAALLDADRLKADSHAAIPRPHIRSTQLQPPTIKR